MTTLHPGTGNQHCLFPQKRVNRCCHPMMDVRSYPSDVLFSEETVTRKRNVTWFPPFFNNLDLTLLCFYMLSVENSHRDISCELVSFLPVSSSLISISLLYFSAFLRFTIRCIFHAPSLSFLCMCLSTRLF